MWPGRYLVTQLPTYGRQINRRSIAKGVAWAVPAVTAASALPALAASNPACHAVSTRVNWAEFRNGLLGTSHASSSNLLLDPTPVYYDLTKTTNNGTLTQPKGPYMSATLVNGTYYQPDNWTGDINASTGLTIQFESSVLADIARCRTGSGAINNPPNYMTYTFLFSEPMSSITIPVSNVSFSEDMVITPLGGGKASRGTVYNSGVSVTTTMNGIEIYGNGQPDTRDVDIVLTNSTGFTLSYGWKRCGLTVANGSFIAPLIVNNVC